jgi:sec-independent protein translocase protein TatA
VVWIVLLAIVVLALAGRGKLSDVLADFGKGIRAFRDGLK